MSDERDDLDMLIRCAGWQRLVARAKQEWGPAPYALALEQASEMPNAAAEFHALKKTQRAINALLSWPNERIAQVSKQVEQAAQPADLTRGGGR